MESFMLWGVAADSPGSLSFLATRIQVPCIQHGTRAMIDRMLADMGIGADYTDWSITHFLSNYFSGPGEPVTAPDSWADTWEICLTVAQPVAPELALLNDRLDIIRTFAHDETWDGSPPPSTAPYVIVCRFFNERLFARTMKVLAEVRTPRGLQEPELADLIERLQRHPRSSGIVVRERSVATLQADISIGVFDPATFQESGQDLAEMVSELVQELNGTTTWGEQVSRLLEQQRLKSNPG